MARRMSSSNCSLNLVTYFALHLLWFVAVSSIEASSPSMSDSEDEIYSLEVQKIQRPTTDDFLEAYLDAQDQETENETLNTKKTETDQIIALSSDQSPIRLNSKGSSGEPDMFAKRIRRRRSTTPIKVDVAAFVDYGVYKRFLSAAGNNRTVALQNIRKYFAFIFKGVDQRYQSINIDTPFNVYLSQVYVAESGSTSPLADSIILENNKIDSREAIQAFRNFIVQRANDVVTSYDHAMLFTAYDLTAEGKSGPNGYAYNSRMCKTDGSSVSVIEETNNYQSIYIAAQQLGHSLSANNDGDGNDCSSSERYIMAEFSDLPETPSTMFHPWQFSQCSVDSFISYLNQQLATPRGVTCLTGHPPMDNTIPDVSGRLLGQEIPPDQQCQAINGTGSYVCRGAQENWSDICHAMSCLRTSDNLCYTKTAALDGTTCGNLNICRSGECVSDPQAPTADESCLFGDQPGVVWQGMTCSQFINDFKGQCYVSNNQKACCKSCRDAYLPLSGCEYGDHSRQLCRDKSVCKSNATSCCQFCATPTTTPTPTPTTGYHSNVTTGYPSSLMMVFAILCSMCLAY